MGGGTEFGNRDLGKNVRGEDGYNELEIDIMGIPGWLWDFTALRSINSVSVFADLGKKRKNVCSFVIDFILLVNPIAEFVVFLCFYFLFVFPTCLAR